ncbi:MAG: SPOR domain-containing protein [Bacteroidales bacterium]|nr:SPOR domain-containing protein [Bacteroidales bacterium]
MNECIILRGIGGFETHYRHAVMDKKKKVLIPPGKEIRFREDWIKDNGVLENHIAASLKINRERASDYIDDFVQRFFNTLKDSGKITLEGIGTFSFGENNRLLFEELKDVNYLADSFGLDALEIDFEPGTVERVPAEALKPIDQPRRKQTVLYITIGILLLVILVTIIILLSEGSNYRLFDFNKRLTRNEQLVFGTREVLSTDSATQLVEEKLNTRTTTRVALAYDPEEGATGADEEASGISYYLIAGSFKTIKNAEISMQELIDDGFAAEVVPMGENIRVVVGTFYDRKEALNELRRLRRQIDQSIWLLEKPR